MDTKTWSKTGQVSPDCSITQEHGLGYGFRALALLTRVRASAFLYRCCAWLPPCKNVSKQNVIVTGSSTLEFLRAVAFWYHLIFFWKKRRSRLRDTFGNKDEGFHMKSVSSGTHALLMNEGLETDMESGNSPRVTCGLLRKRRGRDARPLSYS